MLIVELLMVIAFAVVIALIVIITVIERKRQSGEKDGDRR
jgi:hypothetical protein